MMRTRSRQVGPAAAAAALVVGLVLVLALGGARAAAKGPVLVSVGKVRLGAPVDGRGSLLVPVTYPTALIGHRLDLTVSLARRGQKPIRVWNLHPRASGGLQRRPERRDRFTFVHRVDLSPRLTHRLGSGFLARVRADGALDVEGDGHPELAGHDVSLQSLPRRAGPRRLCSSVPQARTGGGGRVELRLPVCGAPVRWRIVRHPDHGRARIRGGKLVYVSSRRFRGTDSLVLAVGRKHGATASAAPRATLAPVVIKVGSGQNFVVRAIGDSVTAGFGYYDNGTPMPLTSLLECKPGASFYNDACSSNSISRNNEGKKVEYAPDYGLSNNVSWPAQWSNDHGITDYENLAVSGSEPSDWAPGGQLYATTKRVESEDPDFVLMTIGANPLLSEMLFGVDNMGCAVESDLFGRYRECIEESFAEVHLRENLEKLYRELVKNTKATVYLMQYPLTIPSTALAYTATQIAEMGKLLNREIATTAGALAPNRLQVVTPPHFNVGIDISPVYPSRFSCSRLGFKVDGRSVQIEATQDELLAGHPLSFCSGPEKGPPWVISGDTGIHPSAAGHAQMASRVPAP